MSQVVSKEIRSKGEVLGDINVTLFDDIDEAVEELTEETVLKFVNKQVTINAMDAERKRLTGSSSTGIRALMSKAKDNPELLEKIKALVSEEEG
jgi:hypothetical protein